MNVDYWQDRLDDALQKVRAAQSARTCLAYLELADHYRSMIDTLQRHETFGDASRGSRSLHPDGLN